MAFHCFGVVRGRQTSIDTIGSLDLLGQERGGEIYKGNNIGFCYII